MRQGDKVDIYNQTPSGSWFLEGVATLISKVDPFGSRDQFDEWMVRFPPDTCPLRRRIIPKEWLSSDAKKQIRDDLKKKRSEAL